MTGMTKSEGPEKISESLKLMRVANKQELRMLVQCVPQVSLKTHTCNSNNHQTKNSFAILTRLSKNKTILMMMRTE